MTDRNYPVLVFKSSKILTPDGQSVMKHQEVSVQGDNLTECKKVFNELWEKE